MKKKIMVYATCVIAAAFAACTSNETYEKQSEGTPIQVRDTVNIEKSKKLYSVDSNTHSAMGFGWGWNMFNGIITIKTTDPESPLNGEYENGGISRSDGRVLLDTIPCGESFIDPVFTLAGEPTETEANVINPLVEEKIDSIGMLTTKQYTGTDGQTLTLEDLYRYLNTESTISWPFFVPSSKVADRAPVRYEYNPLDPNSRIVWVTIEVMHTALNAENGGGFTQTYEVGYVQVRDAAEVTPDPLKIKMNILEMFRAYRKRDQHSIMDMWMSFDVVNAKTGETTDEVETDSRMAAKIGHFGAPSNGYSLEEKRLIGSAPTEVTEELDPENEEAKNASKTIGKFNFKVDAYKQQYYLRFPVMGRPDSEGGKEAGGERLLFQLNGSYVDPAMDYTFNFQITHRTEVVVKGWQQITPSYQRPNDPGISYTYLSSYVVEFVDHLYLNGEEIVWVDTDDGTYYYLVPSQNGKNIEVQNPDYELYYSGSDAHPFHTSTMVVDGWKPIME